MAISKLITETVTPATDIPYNQKCERNVRVGMSCLGLVGLRQQEVLQGESETTYELIWMHRLVKWDDR